MIDHECPECGSFAFELPNESGDTWCAVCGTCVNVDGQAVESSGNTDDGDDLEPEDKYHTPQVAGQSERAIELQTSPRLSGANSRERRRFLDDGEEW